ncbi:MAG: pantoate--beta-alanine ligase, partial [Candidatus Margulisbacteria bacterium]|nr:pantoate--beta-alanine ligase [Candidatus Margulisiibacteriota bacterium]
VPTMGCLHEGHLSLVAAAKAKADVVVVSIFVNPLQFGPSEDLARYPRSLKKDEQLLKDFDVDALFLPAADTMYCPGFKTYVEVDSLSKKLCGRTRPAHFRGVSTIVAKLFNIVAPDYAFFGEKDFQQQVIIKRMVKDLNFPVEVISLPTVREYDGLAMSSRNKYLTPKERKQAVVLYKSLLLAKEEIEKGERNIHKITLRLRSVIGSVPNIRLDYAAIVDPETLEEVKAIKGRVLIALAGQIGKARLIDNLVVEAK